MVDLVSRPSRRPGPPERRVVLPTAAQGVGQGVPQATGRVVHTERPSGSREKLLRQGVPQVACQVVPVAMVDPMSRSPGRTAVVLDLPDGPPPLTVDAARVLLTMLYPTATDASVFEIGAGGSPDEPEAIAS